MEMITQKTFGMGSMQIPLMNLPILSVASNTRGGIWFVIKCELKEKPYFMMTILFTISIFVLGFSIRQAEL